MEKTLNNKTMHKTIYVTYETLDNAVDYLRDVMLAVHDDTVMEYGEPGCSDYDRNAWDSVIGDKSTRDTAFSKLTNGLSYDDFDSMLGYEDYYVETEWNGIAHDVPSARAMWEVLLDCAMEMYHTVID